MLERIFPAEIFEKLHSLPMAEAVVLLDRMEAKAREQKALARTIRGLCQGDLFYLLVRVCGRKDMVHPWIYARIREVEADPDNHLDLWARGHYKDLADDTPMLTANRGWTTHGELLVGDAVFSDKGQPVSVLALSERYVTSECYRMSFSDGSSIVCGAGHLWRIRQKIKRRIANSYLRSVEFQNVVMSTSEMVSQNRRLDVGTAAALQYPEADLPLDPYLLGCWLGDGNSNGAVVTMLWEDAQPMLRALEQSGHTWTVEKTGSRALSYRIDRRDRTMCLRGHEKTPENTYRHACKICKAKHQRHKFFGESLDPVTLNGFSQRLRDLGVMNNKHVPNLYVSASASQRMDLLRGLMDTDGTCDTRGTATFSNTNKRLARQVYDLAAGLALQPHIRVVNANSENGKSVNGKYLSWQVSFQAHKERVPFRIARKAARAIPTSYYYGCRTVTRIEGISPVPSRCIQVEGGMYLAGQELIPTHNSSIITFGKTIQDILNDPEITVGIFSHTRPIAKAFLRQIMREFEGNKLLHEAFPDVLWGMDIRAAPKWSEDDGIIVRRKSNPPEGTIEAWGLIDGQPTSKHFQVLMYDDIVVEGSVTTPEMIDKTRKGLEQSYNLASKIHARRFAGTRWAFNDAYRTVIDRKTAIARVFPGTDDGTEDGAPVFLTVEQLAEKRRDMGPHTFAAQILLNPKADALQGFRREWLRFYEKMHGKTNNYILVDAASSKKKGSDYTAMWVVGLGQDGNYYALDMVRDRLNLTERCERLFTLHRKWKPKSVRYEKIGMMADIEHIKSEQEKQTYRFDIVEVGGQTKKQDRIGRLIPIFEQGRFYLQRSFHVTDYQKTAVDLVHSFVEEEFMAFPVGIHDDALDALARLCEPDLPLIWPKEERVIAHVPMPILHQQLGWMGN